MYDIPKIGLVNSLYRLVQTQSFHSQTTTTVKTLHKLFVLDPSAEINGLVVVVLVVVGDSFLGGIVPTSLKVFLVVPFKITGKIILMF